MLSTYFLSDLDRTACAIGEIKRAGYDVFLVLEATIRFPGRDDDDGTLMDLRAQTSEPVHYELAVKIRLTSQDQKFLRALKISVEQDSTLKGAFDIGRK